DRLAATVDKWLPKLMDGLAWFIGNGQRVFATLLSIVAALTALKAALSIAATFKAVQAGIAAYTAAQTAATAATSAATVATTGLNAALAMNPVGALIAVLAAVVVGLATFAATAGDARSATGEFAQSVEKLTGSSARLVDSSRALSESHLASIEAMSSEARGADVLADRISALAAKESLSSAEKKTLVAYIDELNQRVPELSLAYNEQTGELTKNVDAIKRVIEERKKEAQLKRAIDDLIESERLLEEVKQKRTEVENALTEATERYNAALIEGVYQGGVSVQTKQEEYAAQQALLEQYDALTFELGELQIVMDSANLTIDTMAQAASSAAVSQQELTDAVSATPEQLEEAQARYQVYAEYTQGLFSTLAETVSSSTAKSAAELAQSMLDNQAVIEQWSINLNTLAQRGLDEGLIRQLREAGPESAKQVQALVNAQDTELLRLNDVYRSGAEVATQSFAAELGMESFLSSGSNAISKIAE
ncbi:MAG TPA: hypothetical protein PLH38_07145, partial [Clostridia bacterium]|nr:hypothetical protein [Clostridia bacterium]